MVIDYGKIIVQKTFETRSIIAFAAFFMFRLIQKDWTAFLFLLRTVVSMHFTILSNPITFQIDILNNVVTNYKTALVQT